jgi:hypothetical protein
MTGAFQPAYLGVYPRDVFDDHSSKLELELAISARGQKGLLDRTSFEALICSFSTGSGECPLKQASSVHVGSSRAAYTATIEEVDVWMETFERDGAIVEIVIGDNEARREQAARILTILDQRIQALAMAKS